MTVKQPFSHLFQGALVLALAASFTACDNLDAPRDEDGTPLLQLPEKLAAKLGLGDVSSSQAAVRSAKLLPIAACGDVKDQRRRQAALQVIDQIQASFAGAWSDRENCPSLWDGLKFGSDDNMASMPTAGPSPNQGPTQPPAHSETNNQVAGVDEADFVKTDGKHIYLLASGSLKVLAAWPADQTTELASVEIPGTPKKLFLHGDRVLVYASKTPQESQNNADPWRTTKECTYGFDCVPTGDGHPTWIGIYDVSRRDAPQLVRELHIDSSLLAARRVGNAVHTVLSYGDGSGYVNAWPRNVGDACDHSRVDLYNKFNLLLEQRVLEALATQVVATTTPTVRDVVHGGGSSRPSPLTGCSNYYRSDFGDGGALTTVLSLSIDDDQRPARAVTLVTPPGVVYASKDSLYIAVPRNRGRWGWFGLTANQATSVHKLDLDNEDASARYAASGLAAGRPLNQFALDEHQGYLRMATTTFSGRQGRANALTVLEQRGNRLERAGLVDNIAPTEDIRSVRFAGDRGYVVTFKKTDPLFVIDLAQPKRPKVLGELKIPGFSTYMHMLDDDHLLTIGYDGDDQGTFAWFTSVALQIFDVSNPTKPRLAHKHAIGTRGSSSEALTNHLAFNYYAPKKLLAVPMTICEGGQGGGSYGYDMSFSGLMVFDVDAGQGFDERGRVRHPLGPDVGCHNWWTHASSQVKRSLIIGDYVYSISESLLKVNHLNNLGQDVAAVALGGQ